MEEILLGMLGALVGAGLFYMGFRTGSMSLGGAGRVQPETGDRAAAEAEQRLREEQEAFAQLMRYSADIAYGGSRGENRG